MAIKPSLYRFVAEGESYHSVAIAFATAPIEPSQVYALADLQEPTNPGYVRIREATIPELFPDPIIVADEMARLTSKLIELKNLGTTAVSLTGIALVIFKDSLTPIVVTVVPCAGTWKPGQRIGGKLKVTVKKYDEEV